MDDWWAYDEHRYGDCSSLVASDDWDGPTYSTCADAGWAGIVRKFPAAGKSVV
jgi:hypothetical protein